MLAAVLIGSIGLGLFVYGKRQRRVPHLVAGILLMVYPYLVPSILPMLLVGAGILGLIGLLSYLGI